MKVGDKAYLAIEIVEPPWDGFPAFLMGKRGERVEIKGCYKSGEYQYSVEGEDTNPGKQFSVRANELMRTKPLRCNYS